MEYKVSEKTVEITNEKGIHARPAALFVKEAGRYESDIFVLKNGQEVNGKSIMGVMMLAAEQGAEILVEVEVADEDAALEAVAELLASTFEDKI